MDKTYRAWLWEKLAEECVNNLKKHDFDAHWIATPEAATLRILEMVTDYETFGFGGSDTTRRLGIPDALKQRNKIIYDHWQEDLSIEQDMAIRRQQMNCDCFFTSANAISLSGEIVNVDGIGNRTNSMTFGPKKVIIVAGMNKVTRDIHSALRRVKEVAAPMRARSLDMKTPCAQTGICTDCNTPQRICRITTILHRKPMRTDISVVLVNESLGF